MQIFDRWRIGLHRADYFYSAVRGQMNKQINKWHPYERRSNESVWLYMHTVLYKYVSLHDE
jgi:hypothetical protein